MRKKILLTTAAALAAAVVLFTLIMQVSLLGRLKTQEELLGQFLQQTREDLGYIQESQELIKQNTGQVRQYLNLPVLEFPERDAGSQEASETPQATSFELAAYDAASYLKDYNIRLEQIQQFTGFLETEEFRGFAEEHGLTLKKQRDFDRTLTDREGIRYFSLRYEGQENLVNITPDLGGESKSFALVDETSLEYLEGEFLRQETAYDTILQYNRQLNSLVRDRSLQTLLEEKDLYFGTRSYKGRNLFIPLMRKDRSVLAVLSTHAESQSFRLDKQDYSSLEELNAAVVTYLKEKDLRTGAEVMDDLVRKEMELLMGDTAFAAHLGKLGFSVRLDDRQDNDYLYFDLVDQAGELAGAFALQKEFGELYLTDRDDIPVRSVRTFAPQHDLTFSFQTETEAGGEEAGFVPAQGSETFLMVGSHEHNADTMIIVHCDSVAEEIRMLSVPRDLYYKGLKINSIFRNYGPARLASELSAITGLNINKYMAIDMYAFIDVVNLLGGIDVQLEEPLIDPTYKVREDGRWSTLYYPPGEHHLDGIAALRIARSRHTSSDFERSVRQQKVIAALRDSLAGMGLADLSKMQDFMQIAGKYLQTNLTTSEMVRYFLTYKDYKINGQNVLNTDNVLYATYTNLYRLSEEEQEKALADPGFYKGGWIVLPKNNDWTQIKLFIESIMASS